MSEHSEELRHRLEQFVAAEIGSPVTVTRLEPLPGGASRESWMVDLALSEDPEAETLELVLRRDLQSELQPDALSREAEFKLLRLAHDAGVAVPQPRWVSAEAGVLDRPFLLMDRLEGESIGSRIVRLPELTTARERLVQQMAEQLAAIHRIGLATTGDCKPGEGAAENELFFLPAPDDDETAAAHMLRRLRAFSESLEIRNPAYELALRWLEANLPEGDQKTLVHGDFRVGNVIVDEEGLRAIVDWEFGHVGDPYEDLGWPCMRHWRFGQDRLTFGGIGTREQFLSAYEQASGREVNRESVRYWEIMGNVRWGVGCLSQAQRHLRGGDSSVELASLGRRAAEMELESLRMIRAVEIAPPPRGE